MHRFSSAIASNIKCSSHLPSHKFEYTLTRRGVRGYKIALTSGIVIVAVNIIIQKLRALHLPELARVRVQREFYRKKQKKTQQNEKTHQEYIKLRFLRAFGNYPE